MFGCGECAYYLALATVSLECTHTIQVIKLYTLNVCSLSHVSYNKTYEHTKGPPLREDVSKMFGTVSLKIVKDMTPLRIW